MTVAEAVNVFFYLYMHDTYAESCRKKEDYFVRIPHSLSCLHRYVQERLHSPVRV